MRRLICAFLVVFAGHLPDYGRGRLNRPSLAPATPTTLPQQGHLPGLNKFSRPKPIEINAACYLFTRPVSCIPADSLVTRILYLVYERYDLLAEDIVDGLVEKSN